MRSDIVSEFVVFGFWFVLIKTSVVVSLARKTLKGLKERIITGNVRHENTCQ